VVGADADQKVRACDMSCVLDRQVALSQVNAVGLRQAGNVGPVVDDEQRPLLPRPAPDGAGALQQVSVAKALLTQLEQGRPTGRRLCDGPVQCGGAGGPGQQYLEEAAGQSLAGRRSQEQGPLQRVAAIAQPFDPFADISAKQLTELLQAAQGLLQPLE